MDGYDAVLIESIWHELKAIREGYDSLAGVPKKLDVMDGRLCRVESDVKAIKAVLKDHSKTLGEHTRILDEHTRILDEHTRLLNEHSDDIAELRTVLAGF